MSDSMTAPSEDAVGVARGIKGTEYAARVALDSHYEAAAHGDYDVDAYLKARDDYTAAVESRVRAECAAKVRKLRRYEADEKPEGGPTMTEHVLGNYFDCDDVLAALEAP